MLCVSIFYYLCFVYLALGKQEYNINEFQTIKGYCFLVYSQQNPGPHSVGRRSTNPHVCKGRSIIREKGLLSAVKVLKIKKRGESAGESKQSWISSVIYIDYTTRQV